MSPSATRRALGILVAGALVAASCGSPSLPPPTATPASWDDECTPAYAPRPSPTRGSPSPAPSSSPAARPFEGLESDWGRVEDASFHDRLGTTSLSAVTVWRSEFLAAGETPTGPAVWRSSDGITWRRTDLPVTALTQSEIAMGDPERWATHDIAAGPTTAVVVGADWTTGTGLAWYSDDGSTWLSAEIETPDGLIDRVIAVRGGFLGTGTTGGPDDHGTLWRSTDGRTWRMEAIRAGGAPPWLAAITEGPDGRLVAVGATDSAGWPSLPGAWFSDDGGHTWAASNLAERTNEDEAIEAVAAGAAGYVAIGRLDDADLVAWRSRDGISWTPALEMPASDPARAPAMIYAVAAVGPGFVAVGERSGGGPGAWITDDGGSWRLVESPGLAGPSGMAGSFDVAATPTRVVAVGQFPTAHPGYWASAAVWTSPAPADPAPAEPQPPPARACPVGAVELVDLIELMPAERAACFGGRELTVTGYLSTWGDPPDMALPPWLQWAEGQLLPVVGSPYTAASLDLHSPWPFRERLYDRWVRVTGHFADAQARSCRPWRGETRREAIRACGEAFVVTSITRVPSP